MPGPAFFQHLGLFVKPDFFDLGLRTQIREQMRAAESEKGLVYGDAQEPRLAEHRRKVLISHLHESMEAMVKERIQALKPALEQHFSVPLEYLEPPVFLRYGQGGFHVPHLDDPPEITTRRVSVVIFLNGASQEPADNCYGGGALAFYGLLEGPELQNCGFALDAEPGLLIAFRSNLWHEVRPVLFGERFTIVTWFRS